VRLDTTTALQFVLAVGNHLLARCDARGDYAQISLGQRDFHVAYFDSLIGLNDICEGAALGPTLNGCSRDDGRSFFGFKQQARIYELVRKQRTVGVVKHRLELPGACCLIDLIVDGKKLASSQLGGVVTAVRVDFQHATPHVLRDVG